MERRDKLVYLELLRIISIFAVILIHVTSIYLDNYPVGSFGWNIANFYNSISRWCIPLFFIISGVCFLELKKDITIHEMLKKYVKFILIDIIIWGVIYYFFDLYIYNQKIGLKNIFLCFINILTGKTGYHLWFLYDLIMIYLVTPILQILINNISRKQLEYMLLIFIIFESIIGFFNNIFVMIPQFSWIQINFHLPFINGYIGCFLLGYYLSHYKLSKKIKIYNYILAIIGIVIMPLFNYILSTYLNQCINVTTYNIDIFSMSVAVTIFLLCKERENIFKSFKYKTVILNLGKSIYGIYLIHALLNSFIFHKLGVSLNVINPIISIILYAIIIFILSYFFVTIKNIFYKDYSVNKR